MRHEVPIMGLSRDYTIIKSIINSWSMRKLKKQQNGEKEDANKGRNKKKLKVKK